MQRRPNRRGSRTKAVKRFTSEGYESSKLSVIHILYGNVNGPYLRW